MKYSTYSLLLVVASIARVAAQDAAPISIQNASLRVEYIPGSADLRVADKRDNSIVLDHLSWWISSEATQPPTEAVIVNTNQLCLTHKRTDGLEESLSIRLNESAHFLEFGFNVNNRRTNDIHIKEFGIRGTAFRGRDFPDYRTLDGESDGYISRVSNAGTRSSHNNLLATFGLPGQPKRSLVAGGLRYAEFMRLCEIGKREDRLEFKVFAQDPWGKLVQAGGSYTFLDTVYVDALTENRFEALETYGRALAQANPVNLAVPDFPVVNLWYVQESRFGNGPFHNNTAGTVWTVEDAKACGFLKYGPIGVRLEPDDYAAPNNQQGWWNDEHFQKYRSGQFIAPYETAVKWGAAMRERGGVPFIYCQTARRSEDYAQAHPEHMLFNDPAKERPSPIDWFKDKYWSYDFTDPGFIQHMREVYANLRAGGVRGMKFDYPTTGWDNQGGFEDPFATTGSAYRNIFKLALDGLEPGAEVHERLCAAGDLTLGTVNVMRIQEDTDKLYPPMVARAGLRWYKNRVAVHYDSDARNPDHAVPADSIDGVRAMFTMSTVVSSRLELGKYLGLMSPEQRQVVSRVLPLHVGPKSARPVDAFSGTNYPQIFDLTVEPGWHQITFYNTALEGESWPTDWQEIIKPLVGHPVAQTVGVELGLAADDGGLGLVPGKRYHVFDFWNDRYVGLVNGADHLSQALRPGEARMMSLHEALDRPQFISTDRHVLQGVVDLVKCEWQVTAKKLVGKSRVVADEPYTVVIAVNGYQPATASATAAEASWQARKEGDGLIALKLISHAGGLVDWEMSFK